MNRLFKQFFFSFITKLIGVYGKFTVGASGAPTLVAAASKGIESIVRDSAGLYTITLQDRAYNLLFFDAVVQSAAGTITAVGHVIRADNLRSAGTIQVLFTDSAGAAIEIPNASTVFFKIEINDSNV
jgi:hypothetical protein